MSLKTWKAEFYPISAINAATDELTAARHSLVKWRGLMPSELNRHGISVDRFGSLVEEGQDTLDIDSDSCALCRFSGDRDCLKCPIVELRCGDTCCAPILKENLSPFGSWNLRYDPKPMIRLLEETVSLCERRAK